MSTGLTNRASLYVIVSRTYNVLIQDFYGFSITDDPACVVIAAPNADSN